MCDELALRLNCGKYYSNAPEKKEALENWKGGAMLATGALGVGMDVMRIRAVIHIGIPYGFMDFEQESGRGGRSGEKVKSTIYLRPGEWNQLKRMKPEEMELDNRVMRGYILAEECRRKIRTGYINGEEESESCEELGAELCDICMKLCGESELGKRRRNEEEVEEDGMRKKQKFKERKELLEDEDAERTRRKEWIEEIGQSLRGKCPVCWLDEGFEMCEHEFESCLEIGKLLGEDYEGFKKRMVQFENNSCCFRCGLPCDMCEDYVSRRGCESGEFVVPIVLASYLKVELGFREDIERFAGRTFGRLQDFCGWIRRKRRVLKMNGMNCFGVFEMIVNKERL